MERLTRPVSGGYFIEEAQIEQSGEGYTGEAVNKLAKFENFFESILNKQDKISQEMGQLRREGKEKSVKFRQLMAGKLLNTEILSLLEFYGIYR